MDLDFFSPFVTGAIGATVAAWLGFALRRHLPNARSPATQRHLLVVYRWPIRLANGTIGAGLILGLWLVAPGGYLDNDWRALGLGAGGGFTCSVLALAAGAVWVRGRVSDAMAAWAISQQAPLYLLLPMLGGAIAFFIFTLTRL